MHKLLSEIVLEKTLISTLCSTSKLKHGQMLSLLLANDRGFEKEATPSSYSVASRFVFNYLQPYNYCACLYKKQKHARIDPQLLNVGLETFSNHGQSIMV